MGLKQIPTKVFLEYLKFLGLVLVRTEGTSHSIFDYPDGHIKGKLKRSVVVRTSYKEIPLLHIHTNLITLGVSKKEFEKWLKNKK